MQNAQNEAKRGFFRILPCLKEYDGTSSGEFVYSSKELNNEEIRIFEPIPVK